MKVSYVEGIASYGGPESCVHIREGVGEALTGVRAGRVLSRVIHAPGPKGLGCPGCRGCGDKPKATPCLPHWRGRHGPRAVTDPAHARKHLAREPGGLRVFCNIECRAHREAFGRTPMSHGAEKSDCCVVPRKLPNNAGSAMAGPRRRWREGGGPREIRLLATCTGNRTGFVRQASSGGYEGLLHVGPIVMTRGRSRMR